MSEIRKEIINRLTKLVDQRKNLAGEIKHDNCIVSTTDLELLLNMINEESKTQKADDMLEELGYEISEEFGNGITYLDEGTDAEISFIDYSEYGKTVEVDKYNDVITMPELKAIYKKCKELGWLDE